MQTGERRKTVTVVFCDVVGSTALGESLDPERLRLLLAHYFERMKGIVERHGGVVEKFIGDAVMAVFGVPATHEDDAVRAVRAAAEMRDALSEIGLEGRIGVMTGEVVTGTEERLATGDPVNVAARLEQAAPPGEVLIGEPTLALVRASVETEAIEPLTLKGKAEPLSAWRLLRVHDGPHRSHGGRFVGRRREIDLICSVSARTRDERRCELFTIVGDAGVGKSRLVNEALTQMQVRVLQARCLPYGEAITYWPVVAVLKQLDAFPPNEAAAAAIRSLLGESDAPTSAEEIAWAFRKTLEHAAADQPVVVVFDDIQWGEQTFLDLIEHVALLSAERSILLLCVARPELMELRPTWPVTLELGPLNHEDVEALMARRVAGVVRDKIARAAGGNPLFIEEMLAVSAGADDVVVPPTLRAVVAARLDRLDATERGVLERAAVEGEIFHRGALRALCPDQPHVTPILAALVRRELIMPDRALVADDDGFRFRHLLIRDAAYDALPKATRADLHVRLAKWLEVHGASLVGRDELLASHLSRAHGYRAELGVHDDELAATARGHLVSSGRRAAARQDFAAAARLLRRALELAPPTTIDLNVELELANALSQIGRAEEALTRAEALATRAKRDGNRVGELCARLQAAIIQESFGPEGAIATLEELVREALPELEAAGDDDALRLAYIARGIAAFARGRTEVSLEAYERAAVHAERVGLPDDNLGWRGICRLHGATAVPDVLEWLDENEPRAPRDQWLRAARATALAMQGRFDEARAILRSTRDELADRGGGIVFGALTAIESTCVELLADDPEAAARVAAEGCKALEELGEEAFFPAAAAWYAEALYRLDRIDEADGWASRAAQAGARDDAFNQMYWRLTKAKVLARRGDREEALRTVNEAVAIGDATEDVDAQGDAYAALGEVLRLTGAPEDASAAVEQALERYERKGNLVSARRMRSGLAALGAGFRR